MRRICNPLCASPTAPYLVPCVIQLSHVRINGIIDGYACKARKSIVLLGAFNDVLAALDIRRKKLSRGTEPFTGAEECRLPFKYIVPFAPSETDCWRMAVLPLFIATSMAVLLLVVGPVETISSISHLTSPTNDSFQL